MSKWDYYSHCWLRKTNCVSNPLQLTGSVFCSSHHAWCSKPLFSIIDSGQEDSTSRFIVKSDLWSMLFEVDHITFLTWNKTELMAKAAPPRHGFLAARESYYRFSEWQQKPMGEVEDIHCHLPALCPAHWNPIEGSGHCSGACFALHLSFTF